jgi:serine/threonine protein kinase
MPDTSSNHTSAPVPPDPEVRTEAAAPADDATVIRKPESPAAPPHAQWSQLLRGHELGPFAIEETLGVGGMAAVLRARDTQLDRLVALKILPPDLARDPENVRRFHHEARAAARLDHPHIARVYSSGTEQNLHYIAFEYVEGETLRARIERERQLAPADVVLIGWQIAQGLAHAVERGVVHRDIKPANIVLGPQGQAKLVDMGLARAQVEANQADLTHSGVTLGTFDYLAPEQALDPRRADARSDIYSLGCTLYHALTGVPPVPPGTAARKLQAHQQEAPLDPRQLNPAVPDALAAILAKMMAKNPAERFASPVELAHHLQALLPAATATGPTPKLDLKLLTGLEPATTGDRVWTLVAAAVLLLAAVFVFAPWLPGSGPGPKLVHGLSTSLLPTVATTPTAATPPEPSRATVPANLPVVRDVTTGSELRALLEQRLQGVLTLAGESFDLNLGEAGPIILQQGDVVLQAPAGKRPVLRLALRSTGWLGSDGRLLPGLTVRRGRLHLRGLRLEIVAPTDAPDWSALHVFGGILVLTECDVVMLPAQRLTPTDGWVTLVQASTDLSAPLPLPATVDLQRSLLFGGAEAFLMEGGTRLIMRDTVLGPFERLVRTRPGERSLSNAAVTVDMAQITWLMGRGPGITADARTPLRWRLSESVVAGPPQEPEAPNAPLLLVAADPARQVEWRSQGNAFHRLEALVASNQGDERIRPLAAKLAELPAVAPTFQDEQSVQSASSPFVNDQAWEQFSRLELPAALEAAKVNPRLAAVRLGPRELRGARQPVGEALYAKLDPLAEETPPPPSGVDGRDLIVDGVGQSPGAFATLAGAVASLGPSAEGVIVLRQTGQIPTRPIDVGARRLTIRGPSTGPVELQALPLSGTEGEGSLFHVAGGSLTLENLGLRSAPRGREEGRRSALIHLAGVARCRLKACQITLQGDGPHIPTLVLLTESPGLPDFSPMPRAEPLSLELENCFIRGQGLVVDAAASRGFQLDTRQTAVAIRGIFCRVDGQRELNALLLDPATVTFDQTTVVASDGLFVLGQRAPGPPLRVVSANQSFFAAAEGTALITVGGAGSESELRRRVSWQGKRNLYSAAGPLLSWATPGDLSPPRLYDAEGWAELWQRGDEEPRFLRGVRFTGRLELLARYQNLLPRDLRLIAPAPLDADLLGRGADLDRVYRQDGAANEPMP